ncbi:MAG: helix-turn-helix transcriptional regulator [Leptolyngbyaceae cyanobacterium SM1_1_3]|nr:helix-turn-helix transcriptional regulator [Leptolyngbyaceae cyanobacterium SM1_1_3]NJO08820.1 helix-turn-helix transcriptional regulator [Leptolyngbyaceae cyanobacterium SL_1_1]
MVLNHAVPTTNRSEQLSQCVSTETHRPESPLISQKCNGSIQRWPLRPGLDLMVHDLEFSEKAIVEQNSSDPAARLGISFCLSGNIRRLSSNADDEVQLRAGRVSLGVTHGLSRVVEYAARQRVVLVHLHVQPAAIGLFDLETAEQLPAGLRQAIAEGDRSSYFHSQATTPIMAATLQQLLHCPYQGLVQRLYMESKALELMGLCFDQMLSTTSPSQGAGLKADEIDRIFYAKDILLSQVTNPPTLLELSHQIGLNDRKLKQGFRQVFGTTVFGYLHSYRMEQAQQLLLLPEATIASVAQRVGYRSPEAFSVAFRRTFEVSPKAYQLANGCNGKKSA